MPFVNPFRRHNPLPPQTPVEAQTAKAPAANAPATDVGPAAQSQVGRFAIGIRTESPIHEKYLQGCAQGKEVPTKEGLPGKTFRIEANLGEAFWSWIKTADSSLIAQAYLDGTVIGGAYQYKTVVADTKTLIEESQTRADMEELSGQPIDLEAADKNHRDGLNDLEAFHNTKSRFCPSLPPSKDRQKEYADKTGGNFKSDYMLYKRGLKLGVSLNKFAALSSMEKSNAELQKMIAKSNDVTSLAIAMKRLEMAHAKQTGSC